MYGNMDYINPLDRRNQKRFKPVTRWNSFRRIPNTSSMVGRALLGGLIRCKNYLHGFNIILTNNDDQLWGAGRIPSILQGMSTAQRNVKFVQDLFLGSLSEMKQRPYDDCQDATEH